MVSNDIRQLMNITLFGKTDSQRLKLEKLSMELKIISNWDKAKTDAFIKSLYEESTTLHFEMYQYMFLEIEFEKKSKACLSDFNDKYIQDSVLQDYSFFIPPINSEYDVFEQFINPLNIERNSAIQSILKTIISYRKNRGR